MSARFEVVSWPPAGLGRTETTYHVRDNQTRSEVLGRWDTRVDAEAHAARCNEHQPDAD